MTLPVRDGAGALAITDGHLVVDFGMDASTLTPSYLPGSAIYSEGSPLSHWLEAIAKVVQAPEDTPTLAAWARRMNWSRGTLCNRCRAARIPAKASLNVGRMLRTLIVGDPRVWRPEVFLAARDERTVNAMIRSAGLQRHREKTRPCPLVFLEEAQVPVPEHARQVLAQWLLRNRPHL